MKLDDYRRKRDPARTPEPFGKEAPPEAGPTREGAFVIHLHDATRRHYDLRIESAGVLASFAVPRGPSLDPAEKRLAVRTEDHPIEYLEFEAVIPEKSYGAGPMILWDRGRVRYLNGPSEEGLDKGKIDLELAGIKVRGRFTLVRMTGKKDEWLLLKKTDAHASPGGARDPVRDQVRSVLSGLAIDELASAPRVAEAIEARAVALGAGPATLDARRMVAMPCASEGAPDRGDEWLYELKLDGVRALAIKDEDGTAIVGRKLRDTTAAYPDVTRAIQALPPGRLVLDGELVAFDAAGRPSFNRLAQRIHLTKPHEIRRAAQEIPVTFVAFDLLAVGDHDLCELPLTDRKALLASLLPAPGVLRALDHLEDDARPLLAFCEAQDLEGVVAKRKASRYRPGPRRSGDWVKMKRTRDGDFIVVGYTRGEGARERMGALDVASFAGGALVNRGKVGSGLDDPAIDALLARLVAADVCAAEGELAPAPRGRTHVRAELVVRVRYDGFSEDGQVLHGVFAGIRDDVEAKDCTAGAGGGEGEEGGGEGAGEGAGGGGGGGAGAGAGAEAEEDAAPIAITNRNKILWPGEGISKTQLCAYYDAIAPAMLPYLRDRPVMLVRYPDGIAGKSFYQWNVPLGTPAWIRTCRLASGEEVFLIDGARALVHVANLAAIPIHVLASRSPDLDACDFLTMDLDVKGASLREGVVLARALRELLEGIGLAGFPKTSGQSGLHVFVPLGPGVSYGTARALADLLGRLLVERHPAIATMERRIDKRGPRVYVDTGQTGPTRTIVAPWAVRARAGATVSTPLFWDEVEPGLDPAAFTIASAPARFREVGDPMAALFDARPDVAAAVERMGRLVQRG